MTSVLQAVGISKSYGALKALNEVAFDLRRGEIMALLGENGAGKSTFVKIISGLEQPNSGTLSIGGRPIVLRSPGHALQAGVAYVTQEVSIVGTLSVAENVSLGAIRLGGAWTSRRLAERARPYLAMVGLDHLDPFQPAERLSIAERQLVEIARLLSRDAQILILDEPTAALSDVEIERVKTVVRRLAAEGRSVVYVTHRLGEVFEICDRVTVFRNGWSFDPVPVQGLDLDSLIERILGRKLAEMFPSRAQKGGRAVLEFRGCVGPGLSEPLNLMIERGEILGLAGQLGSGAKSILRMAAGTLPILAGQMLLDRRSYSPRSIRGAIAERIAYCSGDRKKDGVFDVRNLYENLTAPALGRICSFGLLNRRREVNLAREIARSFGIRADRLASAAGELSGGNQQKVALGKWLAIEPRILLVEEPTRGVDVGARAEIYRNMRAQADEGLAIAFASSDIQEVLGVADVVATFFRGRLVRFAKADELTEEELLRDVTHPGLEVAV
jgi:ribose transport system ATP-binding protein